MAVFTLPVAQYPEVTPPTVQVTAIYPGANALTVRNTVAAPIEEQVSGVENMLYMSSQCTNDGAYNLTVTFRLGMDTDMAQVLVQNRVSLALPVIPPLVQNEGISVKKMSPNTLMIVNLLSPDGRYDSTFLSNYATIYIKDELGRLPGVAGITYLGQRDYSLRAWLDPAKLAALEPERHRCGHRHQPAKPPGRRRPDRPAARPAGPAISAHDQHAGPARRTGTVRRHHSQGRRPDQTGHGLGGGRLGVRTRVARRPRRFREARPTKADPTARVGPCRRPRASSASATWPASSWGRGSTTSRAPSTASPRWRSRSTSLPGSNALETAGGVYAKMKELKSRFPDGLDYKIVYDTTPFIRESVNEVFNTLRDAVILVGIVVLVFLQDWKAMILPMIDVPVSLIGTFAVMAAMGFSLNNLTLFGLVLAIGIVVDDAIVVLENIERLIATGLDSRTATIQAMEEITGPILAITLVLSSVFIPCCFLGGITRPVLPPVRGDDRRVDDHLGHQRPDDDALARRHDLQDRGGKPRWPRAEARSTALVVLRRRGRTAQRLARAGCLRRQVWPAAGTEPDRRLPRSRTGCHGPSPRPISPRRIGRWPVRLVVHPARSTPSWAGSSAVSIACFDQMTVVYGRIVGHVLRVSTLVLVVYGGLLVLTYWQFNHAPTGFVPQQDKGYLLFNVQLPDSASVERTQRVMARIEELARETPGVEHTVGVSGQSLLLNANAPNLGLVVRHAQGILAPARARADGRRDCRRTERTLPARGARSDRLGFRWRRRSTVWAQPADSSSSSRIAAISALLSSSGSATRSWNEATERPGLQGLFNSSRANTPWLYLDIDRTKCVALGVPISELFNTFQVYLGSYYVNNFNEFGRSWQVNIQADQSFRGDARDIRQLQVRNNQGQMIQLATLMDVRNTSGPVMGMRYNMYSVYSHHRQPGARDQLGRGDCPDAGDCRARIAAVDGV